MQYILSLIDRWSSPAKSASAAGTDLAGSLKAAGVAAGTVDNAAQKNAANIRTLYSELSKAETEVKQLEAAQKRLGSGGSTNIEQKRSLDEQITRAKSKVGNINESIVKSGGSDFNIKAFDDAEKKKQKALKDTENAEKKSLNEAKRAADKVAKEKENNEKKSTENRKNLLKGAATAALAGIGLASASAFFQLGLGYQGMARLSGITARAQYNVRGLFKGTDSKPLLDSLDRMVGMLSPATNTGKALGSILRSSFNTVGKAVEVVTPFAERFFAGTVLGANIARLALTYVSAKVIGFVAMLPGAAALVSKMVTGFGPFATGAMVAGAALGALAIKSAIALAPLLALVAAATLLSTAIKELSDAWDENSWTQISTQLKEDLGITNKAEADAERSQRQGITTGDDYDKKYGLGKYATAPAAPFGSVAAMDPVSKSDTKAAGVDVGKQLGAGMVSGMQSTMPDVKAAGAALSSAAEEGAVSRAQIQSPSRAMKMRVGWNLGFGVRDGILETAGDVQAAAEASFVPNINASVNAPQMSTSGQGEGNGSGRTLLIDCRGAIFYGLDGASGFVQMIRATVSDQFEEVREQVGAMAEVK